MGYYENVRPNQPESDPLKEAQIASEESFREEEAHRAALVVVSRVKGKKDALTVLQALGLAPY